MNDINLQWSDFKEQIDFVKRNVFCSKDHEYYRIWTTLGDIRHYCFLNLVNDSSDVTEFENNYKASCNRYEIEPETGLMYTKPKPVNGTIYFPFVYFQTGIDSIDQPESPNDVWSVNVATPGRTEILFAPTYSYYIDSGYFHCLDNLPANDIKIRLTFAPDPPPGYPGDVISVDNKKICTDKELFAIEAPAKYMKYYGESMAYANRIKVTFFHDASDNVKLEFGLRIYK